MSEEDQGPSDADEELLDDPDWVIREQITMIHDFPSGNKYPRNC